MVNNIELRRKILHIIVGLLIVVLVYLNIINAIHLFYILVIGIITSFICVRYKVPVIYWLLEKFERKHVHPGKGAITFFIGIILSLELFPLDIALASIMVLTLGDGIAALIGPYGRTKSFLSEKKLIEGTIAGIALSTLGAWFFVPFLQALLGSTVAMALEATEVKMNNKILSDNILIPLAAGTTIFLFRLYFI